MHHSQRLKVKSFICIIEKTTEASLIRLQEKEQCDDNVISNFEVLCPRSGSHRKVKQMTICILSKTLGPWLCSRSQPEIKISIRGLRGYLLHTIL